MCNHIFSIMYHMQSTSYPMFITPIKYRAVRFESSFFIWSHLCHIYKILLWDYPIYLTPIKILCSRNKYIYLIHRSQVSDIWSQLFNLSSKPLKEVSLVRSVYIKTMWSRNNISANKCFLYDHVSFYIREI